MADQTNDRTRFNACEATDRTLEISDAPASSSDRIVYGSTVIPLPEEVQLPHHHSPQNHCRATPSRGKDSANKTITPPASHGDLHRRVKGVTRVSAGKLPERVSPSAGEHSEQSAGRHTEAFG